MFFGATAGNPKLFEMRKCFFRQINVLGTTMGSPVDFAGMTALVAAKRITPIVDSAHPLAEAEKAFQHMAAGAQFGKIVLTM